MLFASEALAARIERAECRLLIDGTEAAAARRGGDDAYVHELAGGVATFSTPGSPLNKLAGLGFQGPPDAAELERVEAAFAARGAPLQVELSTLAEPATGELLTQRGYRLVGFEDVLGRPLADVAPTTCASSIDVTASRAEDADEWIRLVVDGFAHPDAQGVPSHESFPREIVTEALKDMAAARGFLRYLARRDGVSAGGASMRLCDGVAQLCGAATLPEHRRRGVQSALLAARLEHARGEGCDVAVVTTQPGSKSHENVQRQGFELCYSRAVLVLEP